MQQNRYLLVEFFLLFILLPISFAYDYSFYLKGALTLIGFGYIIYILLKVEGISFRTTIEKKWGRFFKRIVIQFTVIALLTTLFVWYEDKSALFFVPKTNLLLFVIILGVYTFLSVWPQELIYRTFFFSRYEKLFQSKSLFIFINAIVFSLAHIFFRNTLVLILTFIGGILFGITFFRTRSTLLVSIEHALYGNWLFTVGMGQMLAFPGMETP
ncbi:CPBP family intramembrane glutamic endopeptidase [Patiriisocius hiemis]|uniref:CPBP family intramembrane glutamic endopeptidase n=1 Tax=Patiriisocius hiemis TaxID=3075604 RepID=A0ABU2YA14_9FLAO|nr:CPBP family intramembrane glutamic endopeptidase [Constantimarinum sp. W242]MDT0555034.1 CPBP family intramembrane glutamic endopeptidase [Constantimarinum sp. W242]